jgi:hypothetical protein
MFSNGKADQMKLAAVSLRVPLEHIGMCEIHIDGEGDG